ncbi:hypothetical protein NDU88_007163 [Pleurodeles waltl]|uniref:Uncharacterized protein n=1 Tax=Pleurodeles waltl TaxID=8319 RepID=A0AAV7VRD3_PLEWA|nr:hypothetical protein NDU88_007163 [Pleurodeles waltl]
MAGGRSSAGGLGGVVSGLVRSHPGTERAGDLWSGANWRDTASEALACVLDAGAGEEADLAARASGRGGLRNRGLAAR